MAEPVWYKSVQSDAAPFRDGALSGAPLHVSRTEGSRITASSADTRDSGSISEAEQALKPRTPRTSRKARPGAVEARQGPQAVRHNITSTAAQLETTYYNFPLPTSLLTPDSTPGPTPPRAQSPEHSGTHKSRVQILQYTSPDVEIGMAIGSPTQLPPNWQPPVQYRGRSRTEASSPESLEDLGVASTAKTSKWNVLNGLFGKRGLKLSSSRHAEVKVVHHNDYLSFPSPPSEKVRARGKTISERKRSIRRPHARRSHTAPSAIYVPVQETADENRERPNRFPMKPVDEEKALPPGPFLTVEIPKVQMERYSIMFGSVINPTAKRQSLLARRQANLERLKLGKGLDESPADSGVGPTDTSEVPEEKDGKPPRTRSGTSPLPSKSPALHLFPTVVTGQRDLRPPVPRRPRRRSNTSAAVLSPNRQTFLLPPATANLEDHLPPPTPPKPAAALSSPWSADIPIIMPESPTSISSDESPHASILKPPPLYLPMPTRSPPTPPKDEPLAIFVPQASHQPTPPIPGHLRYQSASSPSATKLSFTLPRKKSLQSSLDALAQIPQSPTSPTGADEHDDLVNMAANISIARQIAVSRRQQQMLVPIKARNSSVSTLTSMSVPVMLEERGRGDAAAVIRVRQRVAMMPLMVDVSTSRVEVGERGVLVGS